MFISPILSVSSSSPSAQVSVLALILTDYPLKIKIFGPSFVDFLQRGESYAIHGTHQGTAQRHHDLNQTQVARAIHVAQTTYSDYEKGKVRIPVECLIQLAKFYDVDMNYITGVSDTLRPFPKPPVSL